MADRYWVNTGSATENDWNDTAHWSTSAGGAGGASIPTASDNVFFDNNSTAGGGVQDVNWPAGIVECRDFHNNNSNGQGITFGGGTDRILNIYGSLDCSSASHFSRLLCSVNFKSTTTGKTISTDCSGGNIGIEGDASFNGVGGGWSLSSNINVYQTLYIINGAFDSNNKSIACSIFDSNNSNVRGIVLGASAITLKNVTGDSNWDISTTTNLTFNAGTSIITVHPGISLGYLYQVNFKGGGLTYYDFDISANGGGVGITINVYGSNYFHDFKIINRDSLYLQAGTVQTISNLFTSTGIVGGLTNIRSLTAGTQAFISSKIVSVVYTDVKDNYALGAAIPFDDSTGGVDSGNTNYWCFVPGCALPGYSKSLICAVAHVQPGLAIPKFVMGGRGGSTGTSYKLFKKDTSYSFSVWRSQVFRIGEPFKVKKIRIPLSTPLSSNQKIIPVLRFDDLVMPSVGTQINTTNYSSGELVIILTEDNFSNKVAGESSFSLELQFTGTALAGVTFPITMEIEKIESKT